MQDLELPAVGEADRDALAALTGLTRLAFMAAGSRAVGPSLAPLKRLRRLRIALAHTHEHFLVLHPLVDWDALARLTSLHSLAIDHLAANVLFSMPEVTWSSEVPAAQRADQLLGALPRLAELQLR
jgi:hypothetical protein